MSSILLDHNNKMGDEIICNGLVREYSKNYAVVGIFSIPAYHAAVQFQFRDLTNIRIHVVKNHRHKQYWQVAHQLYLTTHHYDVVRELYNDPEEGILAERQFYGLAGVPHEKKWSSFYLQRDPIREAILQERLGAQGDYAFVHDDAIYQNAIDLSRTNTTLSVVKPKKSMTDIIFDYCGIIEHASEIHVVDSVFMFLVDCLPYTNSSQKLFVHRYGRANPPWNLPVLKKDWIILN